MTINVNKKYVATIKTEKGDIIVELYPDKAPVTVNNFVFLARDGFYDGITFHRVIPGFMAQAGDPTGTGAGGPGYKFADEKNDLTHGTGVISMANSGPDTNGSQFFITYAPAHHLDGLHTIFGKVIDGMDVLNKITPRDPSASTGPGDEIITITIAESD
jgi:cyclophilin family peptidyl-prolyl cis-trans isomerase